MALIKCPECGKEVSDEADVCINCGKPLKVNNRRDVLTQDAVLAFRMRAGFAGPIVWMVIISSLMLALIIAFIEAKSPVGIIVSVVIDLVILTPILLTRVFELVKRIKNNSVKKDPMIYHSDTDEFEISHINNESYRIPRKSLFRVKCGPKTVIYYYDENHNLIKKPMWYVGNYQSLRAIVIKYMDKYN